MSATFLLINPRAIYARYARQLDGSFAVVNVRGQVIAPSFYDLRHQYTAQAIINGIGVWVVLIPKETAPATPAQPALF